MTVKTHAQVIVIGGRVVGCSVLYRLTKLGCTDVVLCGPKELTSRLELTRGRAISRVQQ